MIQSLDQFVRYVLIYSLLLLYLFFHIKRMNFNPSTETGLLIVLFATVLLILYMNLKYIYRFNNLYTLFSFKKLKAIDLMKLEEDIYAYLKTNTIQLKRSEANRCFDEQYYHYTSQDKTFLYLCINHKNQNNQKLIMEFNIFPEWTVQDVDRMMKELINKHPYYINLISYASSWFFGGVALSMWMISIRNTFQAQTSELDYIFILYILVIIVVSLIKDMKAREKGKR
ncbi:MAG: hypothetical protein PHD83_01645 [Caldisericia bacterium]|nr:hypothetical protein [Caldisericia bacterium]